MSNVSGACREWWTRFVLIAERLRCVHALFPFPNIQILFLCRCIEHCLVLSKWEQYKGQHRHWDIKRRKQEICVSNETLAQGWTFVFFNLGQEIFNISINLIASKTTIYNKTMKWFLSVERNYSFGRSVHIILSIISKKIEKISRVFRGSSVFICLVVRTNMRKSKLFFDRSDEETGLDFQFKNGFFKCCCFVVSPVSL